jgi:hypothetical protein
MEKPVGYPAAFLLATKNTKSTKNEVLPGGRVEEALRAEISAYRFS